MFVCIMYTFRTSNSLSISVVIVLCTGFTLWQVAIIGRPWPIYFSKLTFWICFVSLSLLDTDRVHVDPSIAFLFMLTRKIYCPWFVYTSSKVSCNFEICVLIDLKTRPRDLLWLFIFTEKRGMVISHRRDILRTEKNWQCICICIIFLDKLYRFDLWFYNWGRYM